ncbi:MAG: DNA/RNA non-specific endonuclease [Bacteroidales bacterium]|nr:DNA/RNA non-specific endonuclease [Bacteroidales bacterium]
MLTVLLALSAVVYSCKEPVKEEPVLPPSITIKTQSVDGEAGSQFISVFASGNWTISSSASWLTVNPSSGSGNNNMVVISYGENTDAVRTASVTITSAGGSASASLTQNKIIVPDPVVDERGYGSKTATVKWLEIPETRENDDKEFFTHYMTLGGAQARNYSFYWDYDNLVAPWVAYPLCAGNIGSGGRTDEWGLDPLLPETKQPVLFNAYSNYSYSLGTLDRGHQIPSADRASSNRAANVQTFYGVNMTPQNHDFNGGTWAILEGKVRDWSRKTGATAGTDTLYVLTGCVVGSSTHKAYDNKGKAVTVPQYYFKALLRYKNNNDVGHKGYMGCAFWFENANKYGSKITKDMSMSLSKLEEKLGYKLFVNLESKVGAETYKEIKDEEPSTVSWWWN